MFRNAIVRTSDIVKIHKMITSVYKIISKATETINYCVLSIKRETKLTALTF